jgi:hypothetical protein
MLITIIVVAALVMIVMLILNKSKARKEPDTKPPPKKEDSLLGIIRNALESLRAETANKISYEEVMKYFIAHKDGSPAIVKGALLKLPAENGFLITQVFLDKDNNLVTGKKGELMGCKKKVTQLDDELLRLFKDEAVHHCGIGGQND